MRTVHWAVGLGLLLGLSAPDVAQMVAHPVDDVAHLVDGQALTDELLDTFCSACSSSVSRRSRRQRPSSAPFSLMALISLPMKSWIPVPVVVPMTLPTTLSTALRARSRPLPCLLGKLGGLFSGLGAAHVVQLLGDVLEGFGLAVEDAALLGGDVADEVLSIIDHAVVVNDLARLVNAAGS
ncbi:hypothetical protein PG995_005188 [Apiospora arundinis]